MLAVRNCTNRSSRNRREDLLRPLLRLLFTTTFLAITHPAFAQPTTDSGLQWPTGPVEVAQESTDLFSLGRETGSPDVAPLAIAAPSVGTASSAPLPGGVDIDGPLIDPFVNLPIEIRDATSASELMAQTQSIIDATQIVIPSGSRPIRLVEVVQETLEKNLALRAARQNPYITAADIDSALAEFDPYGFATVSISRTNTPQAGFLSGGIGGGGGGQVSRVENEYWGIGTQQGGNGLGVTRKLPIGTQVTLQTTYDRQDTNVAFFQPFDQEYRNKVSFDLVHPLMRGSGVVANLANVRIAYNNRRISELDLRQLTLDTLSLAHTLYWELVFNRISLAINQQSLGLAADLLRENRIRYKYGDLIAVDVLEAEAGVKIREGDLIQAENDFANSMDNIRELVALTRNDAQWTAPLVPVDPPLFVPIEVDEELSLDVALRSNPAIQLAQMDLANARESNVIASDLFQPRFDIFAGVNEQGLGETWTETHEEFASGDYTSWNVGVEYEVPIYRRKEKADVLASNYRIAQAQFQLQNANQSVTYEHRRAVRNIETLRRQVEASVSSVRAERDRLEKQRISHEQGITTSHDLLEVQEDFAQAQATQVRSVVDYYLALIELERVRGTLLETLGFEFIPMDAAP